VVDEGREQEHREGGDRRPGAAQGERCHPSRGRRLAHSSVCGFIVHGKLRAVRTLLNIIWLVLAGVWLALSYLLAGVLLCITIIGIPFGVQSFKLAGYALWPFGRALVRRENRMRGLSVVGNILWFVLAGWWLALEHLLVGILLCITIIGIPLGVASFKMAGAALVPFGKEIVSLDSLASTDTTMVIVGETR
jgi:uncharacterized membrane protein YccF (DUF307 family)